MNPKTFLLASLFLGGSSLASPPRHELGAGAIYSSTVGGSLKTDGGVRSWAGGFFEYGLHLLGPLGVKTSIEYSTASTRSIASVLPIKLARQSIGAGATLSLLDWSSWGVELEAQLSTERLREKYYPLDTGGPSIQTTSSGWSWGGGALLRRDLGSHWSIPLELRFRRFRFKGAVDPIHSSELGFSLGLRWHP